MKKHRFLLAALLLLCGIHARSLQGAGAPPAANHVTGLATRQSPAPIFPDFNNDGFTDLLLQNPSTGAIGSWFMWGAQRVGGSDFSLTPPTEYTLVGAGDFRGDGTITLVMQNRLDNRVVLWYTGGVNHATIMGGSFLTVTPGAELKLVALGDFNRDGKCDLIFQSRTRNQVVIWLMDGPVFEQGGPLHTQPAPGWQVVGAGDFNADGNTDLAYQNQSTGQIVVWFMVNQYYSGGRSLDTYPDVGWKVVGVGDYNGDGFADLIFQNQAQNKYVLWYLRNGIFTGGEALSMTPPTGSFIVGPR